MNALLGTPHRVYYIGKQFATGLGLNVKARVLKPSGAIDGIYTLVEASGAMAGIYYFDYMTSVSDDEGDYLFLVESLTESHKVVSRVKFWKDFYPIIENTNNNTNTLTAQGITANLKGVIQSPQTLRGRIFDEEPVLSGKISGIIWLRGKVTEEES